MHAIPYPQLYRLTHREWQVLLFVAADVPNNTIAGQLCVTIKSVQNYRNRISDKLGLKGYYALGAFARRHQGQLATWYQLSTGKQPPLLGPWS
jgi:DNA-binding NarL/FixJ family response regulator